MNIVKVGDGPPLLFIPGLQGRWEYMRRPVEALARFFRVITFSLADEPASGCSFDTSRPMDSYVGQALGALKEAGEQRAVVCGISFGGLIALHLVAGHAAMVSGLVLVSTPGPGWKLVGAPALYVKYPRLTSPLFFAGVPRRLRSELMSAMPARGDRLRLELEALRTFAHAPVSPARMGARAQLITAESIATVAAGIEVPTLVIVGEEGLDRIVPVEGTSKYARLISGATLARLERTGHQGCVTRADEFARIVHAFASGQRHAAA